MAEKLIGGAWLTWREKLRWHLIRLLLREGDASILANAMYFRLQVAMDAGSTGSDDIKKRREQGHQLYYVLRWMQRRAQG